MTQRDELARMIESTLTDGCTGRYLDVDGKMKCSLMHCKCAHKATRIMSILSAGWTKQSADPGWRLLDKPMTISEVEQFMGDAGSRAVYLLPDGRQAVFDIPAYVHGTSSAPKQSADVARLVEACIKQYVDCTTDPQTTYHYCAICETGYRDEHARDDVPISEPIEHAADCPLATFGKQSGPDREPRDGAVPTKTERAGQERAGTLMEGEK